MRFARLILLLLCLPALVSSGLLHAQATGLYAFGPFDSPGFDTINRGNLNVHLSIPVFSKPGRGGTNFFYALSYDGLIWKPTSSDGSSAWTPVPAWGWSDSTNAEYGYVSYVVSINDCTLPPHGIQEEEQNYGAFVFHDPNGGTHNIPFAFNNTCGNLGPPTTTGTYPLTDNSGYTLYRNGLGFVVVARDGTQTAVPSVMSFVGYDEQTTKRQSAVATDTNGNQVSVSSSGVFTDTMGKTVLTMTGAAPNPVVYKYTDPNGQPQSVTVNYGIYTVQTNFKVSGIDEYNQPNVPLVSSIVFSGDSTSYTFGYEYTPGSTSTYTGRINSITLRTGGTISYVYTGGNQGIEPDGTTAGLTRTTSDGSTTYVRSGIGATQSSTSITDALGNVTTASFLINSTSGNFYESDHAVYNGAASGTPLAEVKTCYNTTSPCSSTSISLPFSTIVLNSYQNGVLIDTDTQSYNGSGLLAQDQNSGVTTAYTYNTYTGPHSIPFLRLASVISSFGATKFQETTYGYDEATPTGTSGLPQHVAVSTTRGNLTSFHQWIGSSGSTLNATNAYDDAGTVLSSTNPNGTSTFGHDSTDTLVSSVTPPTPSSGVTLSTTTNYDPNTGMLSNTTDPNGTKTTYTYNGMLQPTEIDSFDSGGSLVARTTIGYWSPNQTGVYVYQNSSGHTDTETLYDGYGRQIRVATANGQSSNPWYQSDTCYDVVGNINFESYRYQGNGWGTPKVCSGSGDSYAHDALGRVTTITHADNTSASYSYQGHAVKSADENGVARINQVDSLGRLTTVCELSGNSLQGDSPAPCGTDIVGTGYLTNYSYDLANHKTTSNQGVQRRVFQTDWLGRVTSVTEPESSGPTTYSYAYNGTGLVVTRQRPKANQTSASVLATTTTQYDSLSRVVSVSYSDGTTTKTFNYDQSTIWGVTGVSTGAGKGRLTASSRTTTSNYVAEAYQYDAMGRVTGNLQCLPSTCAISPDKWTNYSYDWTGNFLSATDGAGVTTHYNNYSPANEVSSITSSLTDATHPGTLVSSVAYGPNGPLTYQLGNGLTSISTYDGLGRRNGEWVCNGSSQPGCGGGTQLYGFSIGWNGVRNTGGCDTSLNRCESFSYDEFNRLTSQTTNSGTVLNLSWVYDRYGNRWQQNPNGAQMAFDTATNRILTAGYNYDAAGNLIADGIHTYGYDADGNLTTVDGGATAKYTYDALNRRIRIDEGSFAKELVYDLGGRRSTIWDGHDGHQYQGQVYWHGTPIEFYSGGAAHFQHQDWQGTERNVTAYNGTIEGSYSSLPFGDGYSVTSGSDSDAYHFAGLDHDVESNTDHAVFRQYEDVQGRWMSPDPYSGSYDLTNPQSMNRYAYVLNNPLSYADPSGLWCSAAVGDKDTPCNASNDPSGAGAGAFAGYGEFDVLDVIYRAMNNMWGTTSTVTFDGVPIGQSSLQGSWTDFDFMDLFAFSTGIITTSNAPSSGRTTCAGTAMFTGVGGKQAMANGALYSQYPAQAGGSIRGGTFGTVAVQNGFLGLSTRQLRTYGTQIFITPSNQGLFSQYGGPTGPLSVSDYGDANIQATPGVAFDVYRFPTVSAGMQFGRRTMSTTISFPNSSGASCPAGFTVVH